MEKNLDMEMEAYLRYPIEHLGTKGMINAGKRKVFMEGAEWRENNPSFKTLELLLTFLARNGVISSADMVRLAREYAERVREK